MNQLKEFEKEMWSFALCDDKDPLSKQPRGKWWISKRELQDPRAEGGVGAMDIHTQVQSFQARWVGRLMEPTPAPWKDIVMFWVEEATHPWRLGRRALVAPIRWRLKHARMPGFWKAAILAWKRVPITRLKEPQVVEEMMAEPLWFNELVTSPQGKTLIAGGQVDKVGTREVPQGQRLVEPSD